MCKCYFCNQETNGKQFTIKELNTNNKIKADVCNDCDGPDLHKD
jgi:protein-arginine kinase activator protein McsA